MNTQRLGGVVGVVIGVVGIGFVAVRVRRDWDEFTTAFTSAHLLWLAVAVLCGLAAMAIVGVNWLTLIRLPRSAARWRVGLMWFFVGQLGKYVPGGIWPIVGQGELAHRGGCPRRAAYLGTVTSMVATLLGAASVAAASGLVSSYDRRLIATVLGLGVVACLVCLALPPLRNFVHAFAGRFTATALTLPDPRVLGVQIVRHVPVWVMFSAMNVSVFAALGGAMTVRVTIEIVFVTCVSWAAGFVVVGLPGGIGVREAVFVSMMTGPIGAGLAVTVAVTSRVVSIVVDLLAAALSIPVSRVGPPAVSRSQEPGTETVEAHGREGVGTIAESWRNRSS